MKITQKGTRIYQYVLHKARPRNSALPLIPEEHEF